MQMQIMAMSFWHKFDIHKALRLRMSIAKKSQLRNHSDITQAGSVPEQSDSSYLLP